MHTPPHLAAALLLLLADLLPLLLLLLAMANSLPLRGIPSSSSSSSSSSSEEMHVLTSAARAAEIRVLMSVKAALDPGGLVLRSWITPGGEFEGVEWNPQGRVSNISLQGKGLSGAIPSAIAELTSLTGLYLHYNNLNGTIPSVLYKLSALSELYLDVNRLSGSIPAEIGLLDRLQGKKRQEDGVNPKP
jgi:Leucine-rich repeat (LRR) protein